MDEKTEKVKLLVIQSQDEKSQGFLNRRDQAMESQEKGDHRYKDNAQLDEEDQEQILELIRESQKKIKQKKEKKSNNLQKLDQKKIREEVVQRQISDRSSTEQIVITNQVLNKNHQYQLLNKPLVLNNYEICEEGSSSETPFFQAEFNYEKSKRSFYEQRQNSNSYSRRRDFDGMYVLDENLSSNQQKIEAEGIKVYYPYKPYEPQKIYMKSVIKALKNKENALLQSPTGTGKTLCLLCSTLSWVQSFYRENKSHKQFKKKIIYLSRTHTQLKQVQGQLQKTCFRPTTAHFGSRDQFCIKQDFKELKGTHLMQACSKAVKLKIAYQKSKKQEVDPQILKQKQKHICSYYMDQNEAKEIMKNNYKNTIISSEQMKSEGLKHKFCPYYYPFHIKEEADLIFMPYNYILDADLLPKYKDIIEGSILIFDEAHNVPEAACQGRSYTLKADIFEKIFNELKKLQFHEGMKQQLRNVSYEYEFARKQVFEQAQGIKNLLDAMMSNWSKKSSEGHKFGYYEQKQMQKILKPQQIRKFLLGILGKRECSLQELKNESTLSHVIKKTIIEMRKFMSNGWMFIEALKQTKDGIFLNIEKLLTWIGKCIDLLENSDGSLAHKWWEKQINHYRVHIKYAKGFEGQDPTFEVKLVCLSPALCFKEISKYHPRNIIFTSGTLSPMDSWTKELNVKFGEELVNSHVIENNQVHLSIVKKGIKSRIQLNFSYNNVQKNQSELYQDAVSSLVELILRVPNGVLIILPSYKVIENFRRYKESFQKLHRGKDIIFEDKKLDQVTIRQFKNKAAKEKGAALFCVCRGKVCEGIDFSDEYCRGVIFVGVPFPNTKDLILQQKRQYYNALSKQRAIGYKSINGDEWYTLQTMRAVNQGIGRVIRHRNDYGMIFLMDCRYDYDSRLRNLFPQWTKVNKVVYENFQYLVNKTLLFFKEMEKKFEVENTLRQKKRREQEEQFKREQLKTDQFFQRPSKRFQKKKLSTYIPEEVKANFSEYLEKKSSPKNGFQLIMGKRKTQGKKVQPKIVRKNSKNIDFI